jgi:hypothetical protein
MNMKKLMSQIEGLIEAYTTEVQKDAWAGYAKRIFESFEFGQTGPKQVGKVKKPRAKRKATPADRLKGQYMGLMNTLTLPQRQQAKKVRVAHGLKKSIKFMLEARRGSKKASRKSPHAAKKVKKAKTVQVKKTSPKVIKLAKAA